jgi:hypothetical protein
MDLSNILDSTLDDLADMPSITPFPNGAHKVKLGFKIDDKKVSVQMTMTYIEALELADPTSVAPAPDDKNTIFFNLKKKDGSPNDYAQGALKEVLKVLSPAFPGSTRETLTAAEGVEVAAVTKIRVGKGEYEGKDSIDVVEMKIL